MRISDWSSDVCSSDLRRLERGLHVLQVRERGLLLGLAQVRRLHALDLGLHLLARVLGRGLRRLVRGLGGRLLDVLVRELLPIGRAPCRERVGQYVSVSGVAVSNKKR